MGMKTSRPMFAEEIRERQPPSRSEEPQEENAGNQERNIWKAPFAAAAAMRSHQSTVVQQGNLRMSEYHAPPPSAKQQQQERENDGAKKKIPSGDETLAHHDAPRESCAAPAHHHAASPSKKTPPKKSTAPLSPVNDNTLETSSPAAKRAPARKKDDAAAAVGITNRHTPLAAANVRHGNKMEGKAQAISQLRQDEIDDILDLPVLDEQQQHEKSCADGIFPPPSHTATSTTFPPRRLPPTTDDDRASNNPKAAYPAPSSSSSFAQSGAPSIQNTMDESAASFAEGNSGAAGAAGDLLGMFTIPLAAPHQQRFSLDTKLQRAFSGNDAAYCCDETIETQPLQKDIVGCVGSSISNAADTAMVPQSSEKVSANSNQNDNKAASSLSTKSDPIAQSSSEASTEATSGRPSKAADDSSIAKQPPHDSANTTSTLFKKNTQGKSSTSNPLPKKSSSVEASTVGQTDSTQRGTGQAIINGDSFGISPVVSRKRALPCSAEPNARVTKPRIETVSSGKQQQENAVQTTAEAASAKAWNFSGTSKNETGLQGTMDQPEMNQQELDLGKIECTGVGSRLRGDTFATMPETSNVLNTHAKPKSAHRPGQTVNNSAPLAKKSPEELLVKLEATSSRGSSVDPSVKQESRSCPLFLDQQELVRVEQKDLENFFLATFRSQHSGEKDWNGLSFRTELAAESSRIIVHLSGAAKLVDVLLEALETWFSDQARRHNCKLMREHGCTVTVELDPKQSVGANLKHPKLEDTSQVSEISVEVKSDGQLNAALGDSHNTSPDYSPFAIVDKVQGMPCKSILHFKRVISRVAKTAEKLQLQLKVSPPHQADKTCRIPVLSAVSTQASTVLAADTETVDSTEMEATSPTPNEAPVQAKPSFLEPCPAFNHSSMRGMARPNENDAKSSEAISLSTSTERRSNASGTINTEAKLSANGSSQPTAVKTSEESVQSLILSFSDNQRKDAACPNTDPSKPAANDGKPVIDLLGEDGDPVFLDSAPLGSPRPVQSNADIPRSAIRTTKRKSPIGGGSTHHSSRKKSVRFSLENVDGPAPSPNECTSSSQHCTMVADNDHVMDRLPSLVLDHPCCDLITLFAAGCLSDVHSPHKIDDSRLLIKDTLQQLDAAANQFASEKDSDNHDRAVFDLTIKDHVLKVYSLAISAIKQAKSLDAWSRMQVKVKKIEDVILADNVRPSPGSKLKVELQIVYETGPEVMRRLPRVPFKEGSDIIFNTGTCQVNYNPEYLPDRCIVIKLFMVDGMNGADDVTTLGEIVVRLSDLHDELSANEEPKVCTFGAVPGSKLLYARVHLSAQRLCAPNDYIKKKRDIALKTLETVVEWIPKFEKDVADWNSRYQEALVPLSANILVGGNLSLLHAAIYLSDTSLVQRILDLGAIPSVQSTVGSPIALAKQMLAAHKEAIELQQIVVILNARGSACPSAAQLEMSAADNASLNAILQESVIQLTSPTSCKAPIVKSFSRTSAPALDIGRDTEEGEKRSIQPPDENVTGETMSSGNSKQRNGTVASVPSESRKAADTSSDKTVRGVANPKNNRLPDSATYKTNHQNEIDELTGLPLMPMQNWLVPLNRKAHLCKHWEEKHKCFYPICKFIHCQQPWGSEELESLWSQMDNHVLPLSGYELDKGMVTKRRYVGHKEWWTAGFRKLTHHGEGGQEVFYAEGLRSHVNSQGISWYLTQEEACRAVERVIIVSRYAISRRIKPKRKTYGAPQLIQKSDQSDYGHYGPPRTNPSGPHENEATNGVSRHSNNGCTSSKKSASILKRSKYSASASASNKEYPGQSSSPGILKRSKYSDTAPLVSASIPKLPLGTRKHSLSAGEDVERKQRKRTKTTFPEQRLFTNGQDLL